MQAHHIFSVLKRASAMVIKTIPAIIDNVFVMIVGLLDGYLLPNILPRTSS